MSCVRSLEDREAEEDWNRFRVFLEDKACFCTSEADGMEILNPLIQ